MVGFAYIGRVVHIDIISWTWVAFDKSHLSCDIKGICANLFIVYAAMNEVHVCWPMPEAILRNLTFFYEWTLLYRRCEGRTCTLHVVDKGCVIVHWSICKGLGLTQWETQCIQCSMLCEWPLQRFIVQWHNIKSISFTYISTTHALHSSEHENPTCTLATPQLCTWLRCPCDDFHLHVHLILFLDRMFVHIYLNLNLKYKTN